MFVLDNKRYNTIIVPVLVQYTCACIGAHGSTLCHAYVCNVHACMT